MQPPPLGEVKTHWILYSERNASWTCVPDGNFGTGKERVKIARFPGLNERSQKGKEGLSKVNFVKFTHLSGSTHGALND